MNYFRIGDLAKICDVNVKTIRFYEEKELLLPAYTDKWTGYRYYNQDSVKRLFEIIMFKDLGFSLKEIKNINSESIENKISSLKEQIKRAKENIKILQHMIRKEDNVMIDEFINDELVIGKWDKTNDESFPFDEIYFLPNGKEYWVFKWTKEYLYICDTPHRYEIKNDELILYIKDINNIEGKTVKYKRIDNKKYNIDEIKFKDDVSYEFKNDEDVLGEWTAIDYIDEIDINKVSLKTELFLKKMTFNNNGALKLEAKNGIYNHYKWTKGKIIDDKYDYTCSLYKIIIHNNKLYLFFEWKSGDYIYGKRKPNYYVLTKV